VGQARGFDEFSQACYGRLLRQVALVTTDLADAEDVLQEAFARAAIRWRQLETYTVDLIRGLRALPLGQRQAIVLHHLVGRSVEEISRQLGVHQGPSRPAWLVGAPRS
jgi:RNA polymerase sigma-70 factor, ECF subfamily